MYTSSRECQVNQNSSGGSIEGGSVCGNISSTTSTRGTTSNGTEAGGDDATTTFGTGTDRELDDDTAGDDASCLALEREGFLLPIDRLFCLARAAMRREFGERECMSLLRWQGLRFACECLPSFPERHTSTDLPGGPYRRGEQSLPVALDIVYVENAGTLRAP